MRLIGPGLLMEPRWALAAFITLHSVDRSTKNITSPKMKVGAACVHIWNQKGQ